MNEVECWYHYFLDRQACNNYAAYFFLAHIGSILTKVWVSGWLLPPQLSYTNITAPAAGQIDRKSVEVGQRVQPGTPLMAIVSNELWVIANFKETQLANIKTGQKVEIKLDAFGGSKFEGRLDSFSPASGAQFSLLPPDNATGNFTQVVQRIPVKVVFDAESIKGYESRIAPGMSATVNVELK